jgi:uncharacterized protein (DUF2147 family)
MKIIVGFAAFVAAILAAALPANAGPGGIWEVRDGRAKVEVGVCGTQGQVDKTAQLDRDSMICANIVWLKKPNGANGRPLRDGNNKDPKLSRRTIMGLPVAYNMRPAGENYWKGVVYDPERGSAYEGSMKLMEDGRMKVTGCVQVIFAPVCQSKFWQRP